MKTIVITGSTRGIGLGLAKSFLEQNCNVVITGRSEQNLTNALQKLEDSFGKNRLMGITCDVQNPSSLQNLWEKAVNRFERIDIWINNAGITNPTMKAWQLPNHEIKSVIETNLLGTIYGTKTALQGMLKQGDGAIYNMEGMGSDGRTHDGLSIYGTSKAGIHYFTQAVAKESRNTNILIGSIQPSMVITDMITQSYKDRPDEFEKDKRIFNIIANRAENVAPWIVERILKNQKNGVRFQYTSKTKIMLRFLFSPFSKRDLFSD